MSIKIKYTHAENNLFLSLGIPLMDRRIQTIITVADPEGNQIFYRKLTGEKHLLEIKLKNYDFITLKIETGYDVILKKIHLIPHVFQSIT